MMNNLFAYGTLMCPDILQEVTGCCSPYLEGILTGYSRRAIKGEVYPAIIPDENGTVEGILYVDIPAGAWVRLDEFEDEMYSRQPVEIRLSAEAVVPAMTYVIRPEFQHHLEEQEWDYQNFLRHHKNGFIMEYKGD